MGEGCIIPQGGVDNIEVDVLAGPGGRTILLQGTCCIIVLVGWLVIRGEGWRRECCWERRIGEVEIALLEIGEQVEVGLVIMWVDVIHRGCEVKCVSPYSGLHI